MSASEREHPVPEDLIGAAMHLARRHGAMNVHARLAAVMGFVPAAGDSSPLEPVTASPGAVSPLKRVSAAQHTPGPWTHDAEHYGDIDGPNGVAIFLVLDQSDVRRECRLFASGVGNQVTEEQARANGRLAAAAPDLLAALRAVDLARHTDEPADWQRATDLSDAAIAKATGA